MNTIPILLAISSFFIVMGTWTWYLLSISRDAVPVRPIGAIILQAIGIVLAVLAFIVYSWDQLPVTILLLILAGIALSMALFFYWLLSQRQTPIGDIKIKVGDKLLPFQALAADGRSFDSAELLGQPVLFKFFRGSW